MFTTEQINETLKLADHFAAKGWTAEAERLYARVEEALWAQDDARIRRISDRT